MGEAIERLRIELEKEGEERKAAFEANLRESLDIAAEYAVMKKDPGWKRLEKEILSRVASLNRILHIEEGTKLYRAQGESLGIQSILNIVENAITDVEEAKKELEKLEHEGEDNNG